MATSIDQQFVEFIVKLLVGKPEAVQVERRIDEKGVLLELTVDPEDLGRVIGKRGATAQSLRTLLRALGTKNDARYNLKIVDNGEPGQYRSDAAGSGGARPARQSDDTTSPSTVADTDDDAATTDDDTAADTPDAGSDRLARTRRELEDLDDLDV